MSKRLFIIWSSPIFRDSAQLLLKHPDVELVGASAATPAAYAAILDLRPDTILVEKRDGPLPAEVSDLLATDIFDFQLIAVSLIENQLTIFRHETWSVSAAEDLLQLVLQ